MKSRVVKRRGTDHLRMVRHVVVGEDAKEAIALSAELEDMRDVLMGREPAPMGIGGPLALMEVADAYFGRASEMEQIILRKERDEGLSPGSALSKFRKGELRSFKEQAKSACDLGSRRLTAESLRHEQERLGRESV